MVERYLFGIPHHGEQNITLHLFIRWIEKKCGNVEIGPVVEQIGGSCGVFGGGGRVAEVAGIFIEPNQQYR